MNVLFFGSTSDSVIVLSRLVDNGYHVVGAVTQPPKPTGRKQVVIATPVSLWAKKNNIPVLSFPGNKEKPWLFEQEEDVQNALAALKPDLLISACYGQKIPSSSIHEAPYKGVNVHPSLLPRWRGADPVPWTILSGDKQTGVTIVTLSDSFDQGRIIAKKKIAVTDRDMSDPLRTTLFVYGADLLIDALPDYLSGKNKGVAQKQDKGTYARKLTRQDGFIPFSIIHMAEEGKTVPRADWNYLISAPTYHLPTIITRAIRALSPWPGIWTLITHNNEEKRLKIIAAHRENDNLVLDTVQLEGKKEVGWKQFQSVYCLEN